jgi:hypothetical protein
METSDSVMPIGNKDDYNQHLKGFFGEFGEGRDVRICYLQTGIEPSDLSMITLIGELPGSEKWPVRDLFQREVDRWRVEKTIIPYVEDSNKVKFFPPLTLTLLPVEGQGATILTNLTHIPASEVELEKRIWVVHELTGYYRFRHVKGNSCYGVVEWNDKKVRVVAIDGQHRLSALKRIAQKAADDPARKRLLQWTIPVVAFGLRGLSKNVQGSILNHIRSIFVYINTTARLPNRARTILLSDESIKAVCTQELLQSAHENDCKPIADRDARKIPLLFYDWRGEEEGGQRIYSDSSVKTIEEIEDWFKDYFLGDDFSDRQKVTLEVDPTHKLQSVFQRKMLEPAESDLVREVFRDTMLDGVEHLIANFNPFRNYMKFLQDLELEYVGKSDNAQHAFYKLRFGDHHVTDSRLRDDIDDVYDEIVKKIVSAKAKMLPPLIRADIGFRGVAYAFGFLKAFYDLDKNKPSEWSDYSKWFTDALNKLYAEHWLDSEESAKEQLLKHITHDHNDSVVHYRLHAVGDALGSLIAMLITHYGNASKKMKDKVSDKYGETLKETLENGYHRECYAELKIEHPDWLRKQLSDEARKRAEPRVRKHLAKLEEAMPFLAGEKGQNTPKIFPRQRTKKKKK